MLKNKHVVVGVSPLESLDSRTSAIRGPQNDWRREASRTHNLLCAAECNRPLEDNTGWGSRRWQLPSCTLKIKGHKKRICYSLMCCLPWVTRYWTNKKDGAKSSLSCFESNVKMSTFNLLWSIFGERQRVRGDHQHWQLAEQQPKNSHDQAFVLSLVQEVGRTVWT